MFRLILMAELIIARGFKSSLLIPEKAVTFDHSWTY